MGVVSDTHRSHDGDESANRYAMVFQEIDQARIALVGGKAANIAALSRIDGIPVPPGFCVTTDAFRRVIAESPLLAAPLERLARLRPTDHALVGALSAEIREIVEGIPIPEDLAHAIARPLTRLGEHAAYAVRSSATAEDLPTASFAGQHDSFLNISGRATILRHISRCWASLYSERAITYRLQNGVDHRKVHMAVIVQQMVFPRAAGVLFTADPVTGDRKVVSVEASFGLGEAVVSGVVNADVYKVRSGEIVAKKIAAKTLAIEAESAGGTHERPVEIERQTQPALTDAQVMRLAQLGRRIEAHFGRPQDVEWALVDDDVYFVQSRPITALFPVPVAVDGERHVYISVGHQQMMTDAMKPLGISIRQMNAAVAMHEAGGRLFVDVGRSLASPSGRAGLLALIGKSDPLISGALETIIDRDFVPLVPEATPPKPPPGSVPAALETDPAVVAELVAQGQTSNADLEREIATKSGPALLEFIASDMQEFKRVLFNPRSHQAIMAGMEATWWLNDHLEEWIGEKNAADTLTQSVSNNVTSEMGLELLHVADVIRPHPAVVAFLEHVHDEDFMNALPAIEGGREARDAIQGWLDKYGMRGVGEIDITRPRWSECPTMLVPLILNNVRNVEPGAGQRRFDQGRQAASEKEAEVLKRLRALPDGELKAQQVKAMIDRLRTFIGYREYPKYFMMNRYFSYKRALLEEAQRLIHRGALRDSDDIYFLTFQELQEAVRTNQIDGQLIRMRKEAYHEYQRLTPPRVMTSDGEIVTGSYGRDDVPPGALVGLAVSSGTVEGRARVVFDLAQADLEPGDILVTPYTDPSWTPLFVAIKGLVAEVGGLMTHGSVIAREYGLPAVVGVERATHLIQDGQRIRLHGTEGYVELL